ncbi:MAG: coiled-coil domain-containing protein [Solirubrobacterales bacterium]
MSNARRIITPAENPALLPGLFACSLVFVMVALFLAAPRAGAETPAEINARIEAISERAHQLQQRINRLQGQQNETQADLERKAARQRQLQLELDTAKARMGRFKKRLTYARKVLSERIVAVYKAGEPDVLSVVLEAEGFGEMVERAKYLQRISSQDKFTINRVAELKKSTKAESVKLAALEQQQGELVAQVTTKRNRIAGEKNRAVASVGSMRAQLRRQRRLLRAAAASVGAQPAPDVVAFTPIKSPAGRVTLNSDGTASAPANAPAVIKAAVAAGNRIARTPYIWGGGHGSFSDKGYDCSGSVSYVLHAAGVLSGPLASGALMSWGKSGYGNWITVFSNPGHAYMTVGGLRFDTSGRSGTGSRWQSASRGPSGFTIRHYPGL